MALTRDLRVQLSFEQLREGDVCADEIGPDLRRRVMLSKDLALRLVVRGGCRRGDRSERAIFSSNVLHSIGKLLQL